MTLSPELFYILGAVVLGAALAYGMMQSSKRNRANDRVSDEASRALYNDPDGYEQKEKELNKEVKPS